MLKIVSGWFRSRPISFVNTESMLFGVADLMKEVGMSLGSFYGYFDSKEHLVSECCTRVIAETKDRITAALLRPLPNAVEKTVDEYLSIKHRNERSKGCGLAAFGSEFAHKTKSVREATTPGLTQLFDEIARSLPGNFGHGSSRKKKREQSIAMMASLMGGLILSRMTDDAKLSEEILDAVKTSVKCVVRPTNRLLQ